MTYRDELTALQAQNEVLREELADKEEAIARLETTSEPSKIEVLHERRRALERLVDEQDAAIARLEAELGRELSQPDGPEAVRIEGSKRQSIAMGVFAVLALVGAIWMVAALGEAGGTPFLMCLVLAAGVGLLPTCSCVSLPGWPRPGPTRSSSSSPNPSAGKPLDEQ